MARMAPSAEVSFAYLWALVKRGTAIVMMIRIIAITIINSIREKPRRRRCRFIIQSLPLFYDVADPLGVENTSHRGSQAKMRCQASGSLRKTLPYGRGSDRSRDRKGAFSPYVSEILKRRA